MVTSANRLDEQNEIPRRVRSVALRVLRPVARLFITHGVPFGDAEKLLKQAFFDAGQQELAGTNPSMTQLSVTTGLHRKDVRRLVEQDNSETSVAPEPVRSFASVLYTQWITDPALSKRRRPMDLPLRASTDSMSFEHLARQISTDAHARSMLEELKRLGLVEMTKDGLVRVLPAGFVPMLDRTQMLNLLGENLADHLDTAVSNIVEGSNKRLEQAVFVDGLSAKAVRQIERAGRSIWSDVMNKLVAAMKDAGNQHSRPADQPSYRVRTGMYFFSDLPRKHVEATRASRKSKAANKQSGGD